MFSRTSDTARFTSRESLSATKFLEPLTWDPHSVKRLSSSSVACVSNKNWANPSERGAFDVQETAFVLSIQQRMWCWQKFFSCMRRMGDIR